MAPLVMPRVRATAARGEDDHQRDDHGCDMKGDGLRVGALLVLVTAFCAVGVLQAVVRQAGWTIGLSGALRLLPKVFEHVGAIAIALVAYAVAVRRLSVVLAALCVLLLGGLAVHGEAAGAWRMPLSVLVGALDVCVWALLLTEVSVQPTAS